MLFLFPCEGWNGTKLVPKPGTSVLSGDGPGLEQPHRPSSLGRLGAKGWGALSDTGAGLEASPAVGTSLYHAAGLGRGDAVPPPSASCPCYTQLLLPLTWLPLLL